MRNYLDTDETASTDAERERARATGRFANLALAQGAYFAMTGIWPFVSRRGFEAITGPKVDFWLVRTVGVLVTTIGGVLVLAARRRSPSPEVAALGAASAGGLALIEVYYSLRGRISKVYLADALLEIAFLSLWSRVSTPLRGQSRPTAGQREE